MLCSLSFPRHIDPPQRPQEDAPAPYVAGSLEFRSTMQIRMTLLELGALHFALMLLGYFIRRPGVDYVMEQGLWVQIGSNLFMMIAMYAAVRGRSCRWKVWKRTGLVILYGSLGAAAAVAPIIRMTRESETARTNLYDRYGPALYLQFVLSGSECLCVALLFIENFLAIKNRDEEWRLFNPEEATAAAMIRGETVVEQGGSTLPTSFFPSQEAPEVFVYQPPTQQHPYYRQQDSNDNPPEYKRASHLDSTETEGASGLPEYSG